MKAYIVWHREDFTTSPELWNIYLNPEEAHLEAKIMNETSHKGFFDGDPFWVEEYPIADTV